MKKHAPQGVTLTPHSVRIGAASDRLVAGADMMEIMKLGSWAHTKTALRYCRWTPATVRKQFVNLATAFQSVNRDDGVSLVPSLARAAVADCVDESSIPPRQQTNLPRLRLLPINVENSRHRVYLYSPSGDRTTGPVGKNRDQHYYLVVSRAEFRRFLALSTPLPVKDILGQLRQDWQLVQTGARGKTELMRQRKFLR